MKLREPKQVVEALATSDGAGVRLRRSIGTAALDHLDPFLLLDEFRSDDASDYIAGFPDHPHRGFETVTYMLAGSMEHRDHRGNAGTLVAGSVQWMTAGRGIIHSEMPRQESGLMWGFQLWVNLPARDKMCEPRYQEFPPERIPAIRRDDGVSVRVITGRVDGVGGAVQGIATDPLYLDVALPAGAVFTQPASAEHNACVYVFEGAVRCGTTASVVPASALIVLGDGEAIRIESPGAASRVLLLAARPIGEPVARYGPFVMNTRAELHQAVRDFQSGRF